MPVDEMTTAQDSFTEGFHAFRSTARGALLADLRRSAFDRFAELGVPTRRHEDWKYTNLAPLTKMSFVGADQVDAAVDPDAIAPHLLEESVADRLVFVNGRFSTALSTLREDTSGVRVQTLGAALETDPEAVASRLNALVSLEDNAMAALNTAFFEDGLFIHAPASANRDRPVHVVHIATSDAAPVNAHPRCLVVAEEGARVRFAETFLSIGDAPTLLNSVTEIDAAERAVVEHYKIDSAGDDQRHIANLSIRQAGQTDVDSGLVILGGATIRNNIHVLMNGEKGTCDLSGLGVLSGTDHADNHLRIEHASPDCYSREYFKGVLEEKARNVFTGRIFVHRAAQKTDAEQSSRNLLLSPDAQADARPQLEIFADDVRCTHGATTGQIDEESIFYLQARGIPRRIARNLLILAFAGEVLDEIDLEPLRNCLRTLALGRLEAGLESAASVRGLD